MSRRIFSRNKGHDAVLQQQISYNFKVSQFLDQKFQYSAAFRKKLDTAGKIHDFSFSMRTFPDNQSPGVILYIFIDLGLLQKFNVNKTVMIGFIQTIQQRYREIPYHNWRHACCVTHFTYLLLKKMKLIKHGYLTELEAFTLLVSCVAHDVDHRGRNNNFNLATKSELFNLYKQEDSIMERHHIAVTLSVLDSDGCNIIQGLKEEEQVEFIELLQWNILATDLSKYMQNKFEYIYTLSHFDPSDKLHRRHFCALIMTMADLSDSIKTWDVAMPTVKTLFQEFFSQGDDEVALGLNVMAMMDRRFAYIPQIEVKFISNIVRPAYNAVVELLPETKMFLQTLENHENMWLVATVVFDKYREMDDPLQILDLPEMKEKNLRKRSCPELQKILEGHGIPIMSIGHIGVERGSNVSLVSVPSILSLKGYEHLAEEEMRRLSSLPRLPLFTKRENIGCCRMTKNWFCCYLCKNKGLVTARAVRQYGLEDDFLEERVKEYTEFRQQHFNYLQN